MVTRGEVETAIRALWGLLRGSVHYKFANALVRVGAGLVGTPLWVTIWNFLETRLFNSPPSRVDVLLQSGAFVVGVVLIWTGIRIFVLAHGPAPKIPDSFAIGIQPGTTFVQGCESICEVEGLTVDLVGFTKTEKAAVLRPQDLRCGDYTQALTALRNLSQTPLPAYTQSTTGAVVTIEAIR